MFKTVSGNAVSVPQSFPQKRGKVEQESFTAARALVGSSQSACSNKIF